MGNRTQTDRNRSPVPRIHGSPTPMKIWKKEISIEDLDTLCAGTIHHALGIRFSRIDDRSLEATMPVDENTKNPAGILHGGASVVLAESLGSVASNLVSGPGYISLGIEVNASHLKSVSSGSVTGRATPIRLGRSLQVWGIEIRDTQDPDQLVCQCRLTVMIRER